MKDIQVFTALDAKTVAAEKLDILLLSTEGAADMAIYNDLEKLKAAFPGKKVAAMADKMFNQDTSALIPSGAPLLGSFHIAEDAGVVNGCETGDGVVKFYSKEIPAADISTCIILFGKGGGGESDLTVATREQLGHVKIGNGIEVTEDGTISANAKVSEDQIATSDDTSEMLKEIYGE